MCAEKVPSDTLVVFFSRTGTTKTLGMKIAAETGADIREIQPADDLSGVVGYTKMSKQAVMKDIIDLESDEPPIDWAKYKSIWIGGPVHFWTLSSPVRSWVEKNREHIANVKEVNAFATMNGSGQEGAFKHIEKIIGRKLDKTTHSKDPSSWVAGKDTITNRAEVHKTEL